MRQITGRAAHGNRRRTSQAASHRSQASIDSNTGQAVGFVEAELEDEEDSGLGSDVHTNHALMPMPPHEYSQRDQYGAMHNFEPDAYYR